MVVRNGKNQLENCKYNVIVHIKILFPGYHTDNVNHRTVYILYILVLDISLINQLSVYLY